MNDNDKSFNDLVEILRKLRAPGGCNWDRAQTSESLLPYLVEETYEAVEAAENSDHMKLKDELGDLLLHILFQAEIAEEKGLFDITDVIAAITKKMIDRHPQPFDFATFTGCRPHHANVTQDHSGLVEIGMVFDFLQ